MRKILLSLMFIFSLSGFLAAQNQSEELNRFELFAGYSGASLYTGDDFEPVENGFNVSAVYNVHRYIGIKADVSGTYKNVEGNYFSASGSDVSPGRYRAAHSLYNAAAGIQIKDNRRKTKVKPFAHVLVGYGKHRDKFSSNCPAGAICPPFNANFEGTSLIIGGGLDVKLNRRLDIRVIQFDLNPIFYRFNGKTTSWDNNRFSTGIVFKF